MYLDDYWHERRKHMQPRERQNRAIWDERKHHYPFRKQTPHAGAPRAEEVESRLGTLLLRVPLKDTGIVLWGFGTHAEAEAFQAVFNTPECPVTETAE